MPDFIKKETLVQVFSANFAKFLRTLFLQNTSEEQFLKSTMGYVIMKVLGKLAYKRLFDYLIIRFCDKNIEPAVSNSFSLLSSSF